MFKIKYDKWIYKKIETEFFDENNKIETIFIAFYEKNNFFCFDKRSMEYIAIKKLSYIYKFLFDNGYIFKCLNYEYAENNPYTYMDSFDFLFNESTFNNKIILSKYYDQLESNYIISIYNKKCNIDINTHPLLKKKFIVNEFINFNRIPSQYSESNILFFLDSLVEQNLLVFFISILNNNKINDTKIKSIIISYLNKNNLLQLIDINVLLCHYLDFYFVKDYILNLNINSEILAIKLISSFQTKEQLEKYSNFLSILLVKDTLIFSIIEQLYNIEYLGNFTNEKKDDYSIRHNYYFHYNEKFIIRELFKIFCNTDFDHRLLSHDTIFCRLNEELKLDLKKYILTNKETTEKFLRYQLIFEEEFIFKYNIDNF